MLMCERQKRCKHLKQAEYPLSPYGNWACKCSDFFIIRNLCNELLLCGGLCVSDLSG